MRTKVIGERLFISPQTVHRHLRNMCERASVRNSLHLLLRIYVHPAELPEHPELTRCENRVLALLAEGFTSQEAAARLRVSRHTVRTQRQNILEKLGVSNSRAVLADLLNRSLNRQHHKESIHGSEEKFEFPYRGHRHVIERSPAAAGMEAD